MPLQGNLFWVEELNFWVFGVLKWIQKDVKLIQHGLKMFPKWCQNGSKIVPNGPPLPIPIPGVSKSLLPGGKQIEKDLYLIIFMNFTKK